VAQKEKPNLAMHPYIHNTEAVPQGSGTGSASPIDMRATIRRDVATPLAVLRASMESLAKDFENQDPRETVLNGAVDQIVRLGRSIQALVDYAVPLPLHNLTCTLEELTRCSHGLLDAPVAAVIRVACEDGQAQTRVDGPLFTRSLAQLLSVAVDVGDEAVLHASAQAEWLKITLLVQPRGNLDTFEDEAKRTLAPDDEHLILALVEREITRMGGSLETTLLPSASTRIVVRLPRDTEGGC